MRSLLAGLALVTTLLAAYTSRGSGSDGRTELTFWTWATNVERVVEKWNATHPDVHVTVSRQPQSDELVTKVLTAAKGGNAPDLFQAEYQAARTLRTKTTSSYLTTFSSNDPGWFAGLAQQAGAEWWRLSGDTWTVGIDDEPTRKVADYWGGLVAEDVVDNKPMYTPEWNKALGDGNLLAWPSAIWAPGALANVAAGWSTSCWCRRCRW